MSNLKEKMAEVIHAQPGDATYEVRELAFERMIQRGLADSRSGRVISNEDMERGFAHCGSLRISRVGIFPELSELQIKNANHTQTRILSLLFLQ